MQDRRPIKRRQRRFRKRFVFAVAFVGFSALFYQSAQSFKQDQIAASIMTPPHPATQARNGNAVAAAPGPADDQETAPFLQGPAAAGLAFHINRSPALRARVALIQRRDTLNTRKNTPGSF